jgi:molybdopterin-guanine dinucleotide biosynthesis protein B
MQIFGISGYSGSGKTTLLEQLLPCLKARGLKIAVIKHTHHDFDLDQPGKDSWRHRAAGADEVLLAGGQRWALLHELRDQPEPDLNELVSHLSPCDLVLVEGFKQEAFLKLEVYRPTLGKPLLYPGREDIIAVATDVPASALPLAPPCCLDLNAPDTIADFICQHLVLEKRARGTEASH